MTIAVGRAFGTSSSDDRRARSAGPRRSWASVQPFETRAGARADAASGTWRRAVVSYRRRAVGLDVVAVLAVAVPGIALTYWRLPFLAASAVAAVVAAAFVALVWGARGYDERSLGDGPLEYQAILRAGAVGAFAVMALSYTTKAEVSRLLVLVGIPAAMAVAALGRHLNRWVLHRARARGQGMMRTIVVGERDSALRVVEDLGQATYHGYFVDGVCLPDAAAASDVGGRPVLGATADVVQLVLDRGADVVVVTGSALSGEGLRRLSWALGRVGARLVVAPDILEVSGPRLTVRPTAGLSLLDVEVGAPRRRMLVKATMDRVLGTAALLLCAPLVLAAAAAVRLGSPGPAFYRQTRVGIDGCTFTLWKLRTMYADADARRPSLLDRSDRDGVMFKMRSDPRVTPVGRLLRRFSIDELPQLVNVVRGDMSLVGPRPPLLEEVQAYPDPALRRLHVRPGLTGLWQVSGRADLTWEESVRLDLRYVDNWSVAMDLLILWKTFRAVVLGVGAY